MTRPLRLLLISYYSPPAGGPGVQRVEMLLSHPAPGVEVTLLTAAVEDYAAFTPLHAHLDPSRAAPAGDVHRVPANPPERLFHFLTSSRLHGAIRWLYVPDVARSWARRVVFFAADLHARTPFDAIFSTAPPFSAALAGRDAARRLRLPWVSDLRDLWTGYLLGAWPSRFHFEREEALERSVLREAALTVMVTPGSRAWMLRRHPFLAPDRIVSVTNGYSAPDFSAGRPLASGRFVIVHTGSLFAPNEPSPLRRFLRGGSFRSRRADPATHSLVPLLDAMERVADARIELRHLGPPLDGASAARLARSPLRDQVRILGYRPHAEALSELLRAYAAYLCLATALDETHNELVPQKTYEYLGARRPVLAPIQPGDARDFLTAAGLGLCTAPADPAALADSVRGLLRAKLDGRPAVSPRDDAIRRFEWSHLADQLFTLLDRAASRAHEPQPNVCVG